MLTFQEINLEGRGARSELDNVGFPAVLEYLRRRGVGRELIDDLGLTILPASELISRARGVRSGMDNRLAVVFPHFNVKGDYIDWWSARLVDTGLRQAVVSFANLAPTKRGKMFCPPNEPPHAYLVPTLDWTKLERGDKVYVHESCIKAINGARLGYWSIGLNGVWGWGSKKHYLGLVEEIKGLPWKSLELNPVIVFDSNAEDNWDVQAAIGQLAAKLLEITGRHARHILVPRSPDGAHWGFDDYCVHHGDEAARGLLDGDGSPVEISGVELLKLRLNDEVCVVRSLGRIAEQETGTLMSRNVFTDVNYAHYTAMVEQREREVQVCVPKLWLADTRRLEVDALTYMPGADRISNGSLNLWGGMGLEPAPGDVSPWLELLARNILDPGLRKWVVSWFAYPLQNLGFKLNSFLHVWGPPGTGKNAVLAPLVKIYGRNGLVCGRDQLASNFNVILANRQFVNFDELYGGNEKDAIKITNRLKPYVTRETLTIEPKGVNSYDIPNCMNMVTTSNYVDAIKLDDDDRRAAVIRWHDQSKKDDRAYWEEYFRWVDGEGGAALYSFLLNVDCSCFDPKGWAPMTEDKALVTQATRRVDEQWVKQLWEDPDQVLPPILKGRCLMTNTELAQYCFGDDPGGATSAKKNMLGIKMHSAGFEKIEIKVGGKKERFWVIRRRDEQWDGEKARKHLVTVSYPGVGKKVAG